MLTAIIWQHQLAAGRRWKLSRQLKELAAAPKSCWRTPKSLLLHPSILGSRGVTWRNRQFPI
jgi:hypothetical protein